MSKNVNHIQHIKSNVVENGKPKLPLASALVEGELAVNYAEGYETISLKNSSGDIVTFSSDEYYTSEKLGSGFTGENSAKTVTEVIEENEEITSAALNDLETRKLDASAYTPTDLSNYYTKDETSGATEIATALDGKQDVSGMSAYTLTVDLEDKLGSGFTGENSGVTVTEYLEENEKVTAAALNDLETNKLDASAYTPTDLSNYYTKDETSGATEISDALAEKQDVSGMSAYTLVVDFEEKLGSAFTGDNSAKTVTDVIEENEEITSAALNDLEANKLDASAYTPTDLSNYYTKNETSGATEIASALNVYADSVKYNSTSHTVEFYHGTTAGTKVFEFDASAFIIDGMVDNVEIDDVTSGSSTVKCLVVTFNTDAGKQDINIPISDIFDPDIYYTKDEIDNNELVIASALNDLNVRKLDASAYTPTDLSNYYTKSQTSGATEISNALTAKTDLSVFNTHSADTDIHVTAAEKEGWDAKADKTWVENKLGSAFTGANSAATVTEYLEENERVTSAALNDLETNKLDASAYTPTDLSNYYTKSQTSGATEISNALDDKQDASGMTAYTTNAHFDEKLGSAFTGANSAVTVTEALENVEIDVDQIIDSGTSASTNAVATQAVYSAVTDNELVWTNAYVALSGAVSSHTINASIHTVNKVSKTQISDDIIVSCPGDITGATNDGAQTTVIYENTSTTESYDVTIASGYKTPNGGSIILTCPANGFCKVTYINIGGTIYVSGN